MTLDLTNQLVGIGTLACQIVTVGFLAVYFLRRKFPDLEDIAVLLDRWGLQIGFLASLFATLMTLYYSDVLGLQPCGWCWVQRVFLWPQAVLFAVALWKRDRTVALYSIALSVLGAIVALYQHYLQMGGNSLLPCPANGGGGDCAQRFLFEFGYITFPLASFSLFAFLIVLMLFVLKRK